MLKSKNNLLVLIVGQQTVKESSLQYVGVVKLYLIAAATDWQSLISLHIPEREELLTVHWSPVYNNIN